MNRPSALSVLAAALLASGCGTAATQVTIVDADNVDQVRTRVEGVSRIRFRSGEKELGRKFELNDGAATWQTGFPDPPVDRSARAADLDAVQLRRQRAPTVLGLVGGALAGAAIAVALDRSDESSAWGPGDTETFSGFIGGLAGGLIGIVIVGGIEGWEDCIVFEGDLAEPER
jgi:hypothetical protein